MKEESTPLEATEPKIVVSFFIYQFEKKISVL